MGRANPALTIVVAEEWKARTEVTELRLAGHRVFALSEWANVPALDGRPTPDLILHPAAHAWHESMFASPFLAAALKTARARARARKETK